MIKDSASTKVILRMKKAEKKSFYSPASATIQGILKDMYDTFSMNLEKATEIEATQQKNFENIISVQNKEMFTLQTMKSKKGIEKALEILTSDDAKSQCNKAIKPGKKSFFLQTASEHPSLKPEVRGRVYGILRKAATNSKSLRLAQIAATVRASGHLDIVAEAVEKMITDLEKVEKDDYVKHKDYCIKTQLGTREAAHGGVQRLELMRPRNDLYPGRHP